MVNNNNNIQRFNEFMEKKDNKIKESLNLTFVYNTLSIIIIIIINISINSLKYSSSSSSSCTSSNPCKNKPFIPYLLENLVWIFWDGHISNSNRFFLHDLKIKLNSYNIIYICNTTVFNYVNINEFPSNITSLPTANQVDYYKFYILYRYGGIWLDASTYLYNESFINNFVERMKKKKALLGAFNLDYHPNYNIEAGFIISPRYSPSQKE